MYSLETTHLAHTLGFILNDCLSVTKSRLLPNFAILVLVNFAVAVCTLISKLTTSKCYYCNSLYYCVPVSQIVFNRSRTLLLILL